MACEVGSNPGCVVAGQRLDYPRPTTPAVTRVMKANRKTESKPEVLLRRALHAEGFRFRKNFELRPGGLRVKPDIVFTRRRVAVFVDGCFWHVCPEHGTQPGANQGYWGPKLRRNIERDRVVAAALARAGWGVVRVWEHVPVHEAAAGIRAILGPVNSDSGRTS